MSVLSCPEVCDWEVFGPTDGGAPRVLLEVPHGATRTAHFEILRRRLESDLPADLADFFHVNTDVGAPELARAVAARVATETGGRVAVLRCLVPRTLVDCNRALDQGVDGLTPGLPDYVDRPADRRLLSDLHRRYLEAAEAAYAEVCGAGGLAVTLHTYAPRSVDVGAVDGSIVQVLRRAYAPEVYERWPPRPEVDLITRDENDDLIAPAELVEAVKRGYLEAGVGVAENETYRLFEATTGHWHSIRWPNRVLCLEVRRDLLADPFDPFVEMRIGAAKVERMAAPLARALAAQTTTDPLSAPPPLAAAEAPCPT